MLECAHLELLVDI